MSGESCDDVSNSGLAGCACDRKLALRMNEARISNRRQQYGKIKIASDDAGTQITRSIRHGLMRAKDDVLERAAIFAKCALRLGATVEIIKDNSGKAAFSQIAKVRDVDGSHSCL
jgi:hypothetical protein